MVTKRMVGLALMALGVLMVIGTVAVDWIGVGQGGGVGPAQRMALWAGLGVCLVGLSLIPLGDRPA